jgi:hypothetical protein
MVIDSHEKECWLCGKMVTFFGGELVKHCEGCGAELDITPYAPLLDNFKPKEDSMIPETKSTSSFAPWLSTKYTPEKGMAITITNEWSKPSNPKISSFIFGECEVNGEKYTHGINQTSYFDISRKYGIDTSRWVGKELVYQGKVKMGNRGAIGHLWTAKE